MRTSWQPKSCRSSKNSGTFLQIRAFCVRLLQSAISAWNGRCILAADDPTLQEMTKAVLLCRSRRCSLGGSSGGIAAFSVAWFRPDLFGNVISWVGCKLLCTQYFMQVHGCVDRKCWLNWLRDTCSFHEYSRRTQLPVAHSQHQAQAHSRLSVRVS